MTRYPSTDRRARIEDAESDGTGALWWGIIGAGITVTAIAWWLL